MRFLVFGASGFIGSHLLRLLNTRGYPTVGTQSDCRDGALTKFRLGENRVLDCVDARFFDTDEPCFAVHSTTFGSVDDCCRDREASHRVNVDATLELMRELQASGVRQVYLSSSYVFDGTAGYHAEDDACAPINEYGKQKREVELWMQEHLPDALTLRLDKVVGADPRERHLFSQWWQLAERGRPIACVRGWVHSPTLVDDVVRGVLDSCRRRLAGLYHLSNSEFFHRNELARQFLRHLNRPVPVEVKPAEEFGFVDRRPEKTYLDSSRFRQVTGLQFTSMKDAFRKFAELLQQGEPR